MYFGMTTVSFLSKSLASLMNYFPKRTSGASLHTLSKLYDVPVGFYPPSFDAVFCYICGRRRVASARYLMICLALINISRIYLIYFRRGFLVILWTQKKYTILTLLVLTRNIRMFLRMRTFQPYRLVVK